MSEIATIGNKASANRILMLLVGLSCALFSIAPVYSAEPVKIGVLSFRPKSQTLAQWQPLEVALERAMPDGVVARIRERTKLPLPQLALRSHLRTADGVGPSSAHHAV
jgi:hypothetical protein